MIDIFISLFSVLIAALGFIFSLINYISCTRRDRKQATIEAYSKLQSEALDQLNQYTKKQVTDISETPQSHEYKELSTLLARCDHFAVGVNAGIYDEKILFKLAGRYFVVLYDKLQPMVLKKRHLGHREQYYAEFETLAQRLDKKLFQKGTAQQK